MWLNDETRTCQYSMITLWTQLMTYYNDPVWDSVKKARIWITRQFYQPGFLRWVDLRFARGLFMTLSLHMRVGLRGGAGRRQVKVQTDVGPGLGVGGSVIVCEIWAVFAGVMVLMLGWEEDTCKIICNTRSTYYKMASDVNYYQLINKLLKRS